MSTLLNIVNRILTRTGQQTVSTLVNAHTPVPQTVEFINQIYFEMFQVLKVNHLKKDATIITEAATQSYSVASDTDSENILPDSVYNTDTGLVLSEVDYTKAIEYSDALPNEPVCFFRQADQIYFLPTPDKVYNIQYGYLIKPRRISNDSDSLAIPDDWEWVLEQGVQSLLEKFLGENTYRDSFVLYRDGLSNIKKNSVLKPFYRIKGYYRGSK